MLGLVPCGRHQPETEETRTSSDRGAGAAARRDPGTRRSETLASAAGRKPAQQSGSVEEGTGESGDELDQVRLAAGARLSVEVAEMGLHRRVGDAQRLGDFRNAADFDDGKKDAEFGRGQPIVARDRLRAPTRPRSAARWTKIAAEAA